MKNPQNKVYELYDPNLDASWYIVIDNRDDICQWLTKRLTVGSIQSYIDYLNDTTGTVKPFYLPVITDPIDNSDYHFSVNMNKYIKKEHSNEKAQD